MKIKVNEASGQVLDWLVALALGWIMQDSDKGTRNVFYKKPNGELTIRSLWRHSTDWSQGGPIKEQAGIATRLSKGVWYAMLSSDLGDGERAQWSEFTWQGVSAKDKPRQIRFKGETELIAAMRCYVTSKLGEEVDVPKELFC